MTTLLATTAGTVVDDYARSRFPGMSDADILAVFQDAENGAPVERPSYAAARCERHFTLRNGFGTIYCGMCGAIV